METKQTYHYYKRISDQYSEYWLGGTDMYMLQSFGVKQSNLHMFNDLELCV